MWTLTSFPCHLLLPNYSAMLVSSVFWVGQECPIWLGKLGACYTLIFPWGRNLKFNESLHTKLCLFAGRVLRVSEIVFLTLSVTPFSEFLLPRSDTASLLDSAPPKMQLSSVSSYQNQCFCWEWALNITIIPSCQYHSPNFFPFFNYTMTKLKLIPFFKINRRIFGMTGIFMIFWVKWYEIKYVSFSWIASWKLEGKDPVLFSYLRHQ